jgi:hypothetical protein
MAPESQCQRPREGLGEFQPEHAPLPVGLSQTALAPETVEVERAWPVVGNGLDASRFRESTQATLAVDLLLNLESALAMPWVHVGGNGLPNAGPRQESRVGLEIRCRPDAFKQDAPPPALPGRDFDELADGRETCGIESGWGVDQQVVDVPLVIRLREKERVSMPVSAR